MPGRNQERARRKARTIRALIGGLGLAWGTAVCAQDAEVLPADDPGFQAPAACTCDPCECAAEDAPACDCLMRHFDDDCGNNWLADAGFNISGFLAQGFTWNPDDPRNNINGPVTFNDRANEYQLNQLYMILERPIDIDAEELQLGGRVDALFGTDYYFTQALGLELDQDGSQRWNSQDGPNRAFGPDTGSMYGIAMPQLYAEVGGYGVSVKAGHFYTIIGYEVVPANGNFFYSHAYTMQYGEPFTHTGFLASFSLTENIAATSGAVLGWDNWDDTNDAWSYLGGITLTSDDGGTSLAFAIITGDERTQLAPTFTRENRTMYSVVFSQQLTDEVTYVLQHDQGWQDNAGGPGTGDARWYGINQYLFYQVSDNVRAGLRGEWFRDDDGFRVVAGGGTPADYYQITGGLNINLADCVLLRPEVRWDWCDGATPYDDFSDDDQFLFATDLIWQF